MLCHRSLTCLSVAEIRCTINQMHPRVKLRVREFATAGLFPLCLRLMWGLCVRRPVGQRGRFKSGSGGGGTKTVQHFVRGSVRPGVCACMCVMIQLMWEHVRMCKYVTLLFLSVNSWRCVFYFFAFVYGVLALHDVSSFVLFFIFFIAATVSITGFVSGVTHCFHCTYCLLFLLWDLFPALFCLYLSHHVKLLASLRIFIPLGASGFFSHSGSWHGR